MQFQESLKTPLRFIKFILPYRSRWLAMLALGGLGDMLGLVNPYLTKFVVDGAMMKKDLRLFIILALTGASIFVLSGLINGMRQFLDRYIELRVNFDLNKKVFRHIQNFSFAWFQNKSTGEHLYKINYDIERIKGFITTTPSEFVSLIPRILFTLAIVVYLNWRMAVFSLILVPILYLPPYYFIKRLRLIWEDLIRNSEDMFKTIEEIFSHIQLVKVFAKEASSVRSYLRRLIANVRLEVKSTQVGILSAFTGNIADKIIMGLITFYGGYQVIKGQMTLGSLTAIMVYLTQLMALQSRVASFFQTTALGLVSCKRMASILDEEELVDSKNAPKVLFKKAEINFQDVSFGYRQGEHILKDINFHIAQGSHISFAGPSGCGKTTILYLILRLYEPRDGEIIIGGYNIRNIKLNSLREQIGMVLQEPFLWNDTIENNIRYAKVNATKNEIIEAAQMSGVDEIARDLPLGYETVIGENACKLSEGQKQRIAIARALIKNPKILILDEATSSVDSESEEKILFNIKERHRGVTLITVSHRLSTLFSADLVYFLAGANELIIDKAQNLLQYNKKFSDLFAGQKNIDFFKLFS